ncbi:MAG: PqqD family protein [Acutalibacteraceae bacterium]
MKLKEGFLLRQLAGEYVVVPVGEASLDLRGMITLNETGAFLWEQLQSEQTEQTLTDKLLADYAVDEAQARRDVASFTEKLRQQGLLIE